MLQIHETRGTRKGPHENIGPSESVGAKWSVRSRRARDRLGQRVRPSADSRGPRRIHSTHRIKYARRHLRLTSARFYLPLHQCIGGTRSPDATEIGATSQRRAWAPRRQTRADIRLYTCGKARERPAWRGTVERGVRIGTALNAACSMHTGSERSRRVCRCVVSLRALCAAVASSVGLYSITTSELVYGYVARLREVRLRDHARASIRGVVK